MIPLVVFITLLLTLAIGYLIGKRSVPKLRDEITLLKAEKDGAYLERNRLVAALAKHYPAGIRDTQIEGWSPEWNGCVYIDLPSGQASWHYHTDHASLFMWLPPYTKPWDGHSTDEKYTRLRTLAVRREPTENELEDALEAAYWRFDARHKGLAEWKAMPQSERDAFKAEGRGLAKRYFPTKQ